MRNSWGRGGEGWEEDTVDTVSPSSQGLRTVPSGKRTQRPGGHPGTLCTGTGSITQTLWKPDPSLGFSSPAALLRGTGRRGGGSGVRGSAETTKAAVLPGGWKGGLRIQEMQAAPGQGRALADAHRGSSLSEPSFPPCNKSAPGCNTDAQPHRRGHRTGGQGFLTSST